jgi:hypothetical protein
MFVAYGGGVACLLGMGSEKQRPISRSNRKLIISCCRYCTSGALRTVGIAAATGVTDGSINRRFVVAGFFEKDTLWGGGGGWIFGGKGERNENFTISRFLLQALLNG